MNFSDQIRELARYRDQPNVCPYVPSETAAWEYRIFESITPIAYGELLRRGWRRFGRALTRPSCPECNKCVAIRIKVSELKMSRSQERALAANQKIHVEVHPPSFSQDALRLWNRYHQFMERERGWKPNPVSAEDYHRSFLEGKCLFARQFSYFDECRLVGVALADVVKGALSNVYFFYDPDWRQRSPGVFSILTTARFARAKGLHYQYLGSWIAECPSMSYKSNYNPHESLAFYPTDDEEPVWLPGGDCVDNLRQQ